VLTRFSWIDISSLRHHRHQRHRTEVHGAKISAWFCPGSFASLPTDVVTATVQICRSRSGICSSPGADEFGTCAVLPRWL
jgi:hypothetical protein